MSKTEQSNAAAAAAAEFYQRSQRVDFAGQILSPLSIMDIEDEWLDWRKGFIFVTSATHIHFMHDNALQGFDRRILTYYGWLYAIRPLITLFSAKRAAPCAH